MGGGTHSSGFSSYEGAVRRALRANENIRKTPVGVFLFFVQTAGGGLGLRPGCGGAALPEIRNSLRSCYFSAPPLPLPDGEGFCNQNTDIRSQRSESIIYPLSLSSNPPSVNFLCRFNNMSEKFWQKCTKYCAQVVQKTDSTQNVVKSLDF